MKHITFLSMALAGGLMAQAPPPPTLTSIVPSSLPAGSPTQDIVANGTGFDSCTRVRWNGQDLTTFVLVSSTQMRAQVSSARLANPGTATVSMFRYFPVFGGPTAACQTTGQGSNSLTFTITVPPPVITNSSPLPNGVLGQNYLVQFNVNGGVPPYDFSLGGTMLPPGLSLSVRGLITGTPTQVGTFNFRVTVTDCDGVQTPTCGPQTTAASFSITVVRPPAPSITTPSPLPPGAVGQQYSTTIQATGGVVPYRFLLDQGSSLPPGLNLAAAGGLSGIPTASGSFTFTIRVEDCVGFSAAACPPLFSTRQFTMVVQSNLRITTPSLSPATACQNLPPQQMQATGGVQPYTWSATGLPQGLSINPATGIISGLTTVAGTSQVTITVRDAQQQSDTQNYTLTVGASQFQITTSSLPGGRVGTPYASTTLQAAGGILPLSWTVDAQIPPGLSIGSANGTVSGTPSQAGLFNPNFRVRDANQCEAFRQIPVLIDPPLLQITTAALNSGVVGQPYSQQMQATGGTQPFSWSASGLAPGLQIDPVSGLIGGTPAQAGTFNVTVTVNDRSERTASRSFVLTISSALTITTAVLAPAQVGQPYDQLLVAQGGAGALTWSATGLPSGLGINPATGQISGIPAVGGDFNVSVLVRDSANATASRSYILNVLAVLTIINESPLPQGTVGAAYDLTFSARGGATPFRFSALTPLPPGLSLDIFGRMTGTPSQAGLFNLTVQVTDAGGATASKSFQLRIAGAFRITTDALPAGVLNQAYNVTLATTGGTPPVQWSLQSGTLPQGLTFNNANGNMSGTPRQTGDFPISVRATDGAQLTDTRSYTLTIRGAFRITTDTLPDGTAGAAYSQTLQTTGGTGALAWSVYQGSLPDGLSLGAASGVISGTPSRAGRFTFTVSVRDTANQTAQQGYTVNIVEQLAISTANLPAGTVGAAYSTTITATGGETPYAWSATGNLPDGVSLNGTTGVLSGTPTRAAAFDFTIFVRDRANRSASRSYSIVVGAGLAIGTATLPAGTVGQAYSTTVQATGGAAGRTWSATGLPPGLTIAAATGVISGVPTVSGDFTVALAVRDSQGATANRSLALRINAITISRLNITSENPQAGQQSAVSVALTENAPVELRGELRVSFASAVGVNNPQVAFSTGATAAFRIPAGQTAAVFDAGNVTLQVGTVAGTITVTSRLTANNVDVTPTPAPTATIVIARAAPVITNLVARREGNRLIVEVTGFATGREVATAEVQMQPAPGAAVANTNFNIAVGAAFTPYYQGQASIPFGSSFLLTLPFDVTGNPGAVTGVTVTLINPQGRSQSRSANF